MAKWVSAAFQDGGLLYLKNTATKELLLKSYTFGQSYATVLANAIASADVVPADIALSTSGNNRVATTASKSAPASASSGPSPDLHFAFTDGTGAVIWVTEETSDQVVTSGNAVNFPPLSYTIYQPT